MPDGRWLREPPDEPGDYLVADNEGDLFAVWPREAYFNALDKWEEWVEQFDGDGGPVWVWSEPVDLPPVPETAADA